jgi:mannose-6-phosphate isomerase-like protein (cupin superfamily)
MKAARHALLAGLVAAALAIAHALAAGDARAPVLDALFADARTTLSLEALAARVTLAAGEDFRVVELARDARTSHHVVAIRGREAPHRHDRHALLVLMLRGHGRMRLGAEERAVGTGSLLYVPAGSVHAFRNESSEPAIAYAVYAPPFDGRDRVDVP